MSRSTASIQMFPIPLKAAAARAYPRRNPPAVVHAETDFHRELRPGDVMALESRWARSPRRFITGGRERLGSTFGPRYYKSRPVRGRSRCEFPFSFCVAARGRPYHSSCARGGRSAVGSCRR
jgi:hypothetical protein